MKQNAGKRTRKEKMAKLSEEAAESIRLRESTLELLEKAIDITRQNPDATQYTALSKALTAFKTADEMAAKKAPPDLEGFQIPPKVIAMIESNILGIRRERDEAGKEAETQ